MRKSELVAIVRAHGLVVEGNEKIEELVEALNHLARPRPREQGTA